MVTVAPAFAPALPGDPEKAKLARTNRFNPLRMMDLLYTLGAATVSLLFLPFCQLYQATLKKRC